MPTTCDWAASHQLKAREGALATGTDAEGTAVGTDADRGRQGPPSALPLTRERAQEVVEQPLAAGDIPLRIIVTVFHRSGKEHV